MIKGLHYGITRENLLMHELIGLEAEVVESSDKSRICRGKIIDETKNTLTMECDGEKIKKIPKKEAVFEFKLGDEKARVDGKRIVARPHERTKMLGGKKYG